MAIVFLRGGAYIQAAGIHQHSLTPHLQICPFHCKAASLTLVINQPNPAKRAEAPRADSAQTQAAWKAVWKQVIFIFFPLLLWVLEGVRNRAYLCLQRPGRKLLKSCDLCVYGKEPAAAFLHLLLFKSFQKGLFSYILLKKARG